MAERNVGAARRSLIAIALVGFVLVTTGVILRRVYGVQQERDIRDLRRTRDALDAERMRLDASIRDASSRARLQPIAEQQLNMHIPKPEEQVFLKRSSSDAQPATPSPSNPSATPNAAPAPAKPASSTIKIPVKPVEPPYDPR
ncbi:MAG TPA: cell division protein FtsL [Gemmatimonadaceae bacterium]|jgi:cell division protein FtsL